MGRKRAASRWPCEQLGRLEQAGCRMWSPLRPLRVKALAWLGLFLLSSLFNLALGSANQVRFDRVSAKHGFPQISVTSVYQDRRGFLWLATSVGLARYDGYEFRFFKHEPFDSTSPIGNDIDQIVEDLEGQIWLSTGNGVNRYNRKEERFYRYEVNPGKPGGLRSRPLEIFCDQAGTIWIGSTDKGLFRYDRVSDSFTNFSHDPMEPHSLSNDRVTAIFETSDGRLFIATDGGGLNQYHHESEQFSHYFDYFEDPGFGISFGYHMIPRTGAQKPIVEGADGHLWLITTGGGLIWLDPESGEHIQYIHDPNLAGSISDNVLFSIFQDSRGWLWLATGAGRLDVFNPATQRRIEVGNGMPELFTTNPADYYSFAEDVFGNIWIGTRDKGLFMYEVSRNRIRHFPHDSSDIHSIPDNRVTLVHYDRSNSLWVGSQAGGVSKFSDYLQKFPQHRGQPLRAKGLPDVGMTSLFEDIDQRLWIGTDGAGLLRYEPELNLVQRRFRHDPAQETSLRNDHVTSLQTDYQGRLWIGTEEGLDRLMPDGETFRHYTLPWMGKGHVSSLFVDRDGELWIGSKGDILFRYDPELDKVQAVDLKTGGTGSWSAEISTITQDQEGYLWLGHAGVGLHRWKPGDDQLVTYRHDLQRPEGLSHDMISCLLLDKRGRLWVGTQGGGLNLWREGTQRFDKFTQKSHGLPSNTIYGLLEDKDGRIWVSLQSGLTVISSNLEEVRHYDGGDGLVANTSEAHAFARNRRNQFFYAGLGGFNQFLPHNLPHNPQPPSMAITGFRVMGKSKALEIDQNQVIDLSYRDAFFEVEFAALDYTYPDKNQYAFKLDGWQDQWVDNGTRREAIFSNLGGGTYTFHVKGTNNDGVWSQEQASLVIRIRPPFWRTLWFYGLEGLALLGLVLFAFRFQRQRLKNQQQEAIMALELNRTTEELDRARKLQLSMLPEENLSTDWFDLFAVMRTAAEVGGDYYDFFQLGRDRYSITVGDATGHGFAAGLVVGMTKLGATVLSAEQRGSLREMMEELNLGLKKSLSDKTMGMALGTIILEHSPCRASMAFSGMPYPYHFSVQANQLETLVMKGPPLGYFDRIFVQEKHVDLVAGDYLIFLSDGIAERFDTRNQLWGSKAVEACLQNACAQALAPEAVAQTLLKACEEFAGGRLPEDDMTVVVVRIRKTPEENSSLPS